MNLRKVQRRCLRGRAREFWFRQDEETWVFLEGDPSWRDLLNGTFNFFYRRGKAALSMRMTDSRVWRTRLRIFSYSICSSVLPSASLPTFWRKRLYSSEWGATSARMASLLMSG